MMHLRLFHTRARRANPGRSATPGGRRAPAACCMMALLTVSHANVADAQQARTALSPDTILVGDVFRAALRIDLPAGVTLSAPDTLDTTGEIENAGRMRRTTRELPDGGTEVTLVYPVTAWRTGELELPQLTITLNGPDGAREVAASFPGALVISVLPVDTAGLEPRPPKDVLGPGRLLWPWIVGALTFAAALAALVYYRRRLRDRVPALTFDVAHAGTPKERALAALDAIRGRGLVEAGQFKEFYSGLTEVLRAFLEEFDTAWGTELTSAEVVDACRHAVASESAAILAELLGAADQVKFNRRRPAPAEALGEWEAARRWIDHFHLRGPTPSGVTGAPEREPAHDPEGPR